MEEQPPAMDGISSRRQKKRGGPPAWGLGMGLTTFHHKKLIYEYSIRASDMDGFFGKTIQAMEYRYEILIMKCTEFV
jgi:hypothetical protein